MNKDNFLDYPMWHRIETPFVENWLLILSGDQGREDFNEHVRREHPEWNDDMSMDGMCYKNFIYVEDIEKNHKVLFHELAHYIDDVIKELSCEDEKEFKACITAYVFESVFQAIKENS